MVREYERELDQWREEEANYEEKSDPPEWSWTRLGSGLMHQPVVCSVTLFLCGCALTAGAYTRPRIGST
jgi:hypothetical protein